MKARQTWITVGTAVVSFALGIMAAPSLRKPEGHVAPQIRQTKSTSPAPSPERTEDPDTAGTRSGSADRGGRKQSSGPRMSIPLTTISEVIRQQQVSTSFNWLDFGVEKSLTLLGATEEEKKDVLDHLSRLEAEILEEEKKHLKMIQTDPTEIRVDNRSMEEFARAITRQAQDGIRARLPGDMAEVLVTSIDWDKYYPTDDKSIPSLTIVRNQEGKLQAWIRTEAGGGAFNLDSKYPDDGTPIPADEIFPEGRWKPFLKGLTLLPRNGE
ncbi:MAG: hypothetical protein EOP88_16525 [Verrucomicrobiaceae bacterium]|nr:MAG: hypothetical protein EOP88_16525 [Verrucomicrobiaceae bacterium]